MRLILPMLLAIIAVCISVPSPASAEDGYSQGYMGVPNWVLDRMDKTAFNNFPGEDLTIEEPDAIPEEVTYIDEGNKNLNSGAYRDAVKSYESAIALNESSFDAWVGRGLALENLMRYQTAVDSFDKAVGITRQGGSSWVAYAGKARSSFALQKYLTASNAYADAIEQFGSSGSSNIDDLADLYTGLAESYLKLGKKDEATAAQDKADELKQAVIPIAK
ncbi:MAG TPA: tetratricopeptide repeat protein [Methanospirillum sp.]|nr:tetratricopeptide repeat protein [Methanospirillum sp.]